MKELAIADPKRTERCPNATYGGGHEWHFNGGYTQIDREGRAIQEEDWSCQLCGQAHYVNKVGNSG